VRALLAEMAGKTTAELMGPPDPYEVPRQRRRSVVPVEVQVGETRYWVGLVKSRGVERDPEPTSPTSPRKVLPTHHVRLRPFTRLLTRGQSRIVLLFLQERCAERIPPGWLVSDAKLVAEVKRHFAKKKG
jgi:hypothetical protein